MKKIIFISFAASFFCLIGFGQKIKDAELPAAVKTSFQNKYPGISAKWEKEEGNYEANFKKEGNQMSATFQPNGTFLEFEVSIKESALPAAAQSYIQANYKGKSVKETAKITSATGTITYEAEIEGRDLIFGSDGKFLKVEKN
jgi:hypothetical protein